MTIAIVRICETCNKPIPAKSQGKRFCSRSCIVNVPPIEDRFWTYVDVKGPDDCWLWLRAIDSKGYGVLTIKYKTVRAHRKAYELSKGPIPAGLLVCHRCDVRNCVNPNHLFAGTYFDNALDMFQKGRSKPPHHLGESHGNAKITDDIVRMIRADDRPASAISRDTGVSKTNVRRIQNRETWKHVT